MAKKSKTQRAKASANRQAKKQNANKPVVEVVEEAPKKKFFASKKQDGPKLQAYQEEKKGENVKTSRTPGFISQVRSEMRRVTWPSKKDVLQWSGVVIAALIFFGLFCVVLDDWVVTPILFAISGLGV